jgi:hypothetical protein
VNDRMLFSDVVGMVTNSKLVITYVSERRSENCVHEDESY